MSTSFSIDLKQYTLYRAIGAEKELLKQRVDRSDVIACLSSLGYNNISEMGIVRTRFGVIPCLEETLTGVTLGIPTSAQVEVKAMGRNNNHLLFTFSF